MASDKIIPARFDEMLKLEKLLPRYQGLFFTDKDGNPIYSKHPPKHKLRKTVQKDIAEMLNISNVTFSRNVNGHQAPDEKMFSLFKKYYCVSREYLTGQSDYKNEYEEFQAHIDEMHEGSQNQKIIETSVAALMRLHGVDWDGEATPHRVIIDKDKNTVTHEPTPPATIFHGVPLYDWELCMIAQKVFDNVWKELDYTARFKSAHKLT